MDLLDAAGGDERLVLLGRGQQEGRAGGIEQLRDVGPERQAGGHAAQARRGCDRGAEDGLVAAVHAVELADGQDKRRVVGGGEGH